MGIKFKFLKKILVGLYLAWTILLFTIAIYIGSSNYKNADDLALERASTSINNNNAAFRAWTTTHGGIYVPTTKQTPSNEYLDIKNRDVVINDINYTLTNPAYSLKQMMNINNNRHGEKSKIINIIPKNPDNKADTWEADFLEKMTSSKKEYYEFTTIENRPYLRFISPLITDETCLKCHASQGYKVGNVGGALSISIPLDRLYKAAKNKNIIELLIFIFIWLTGSIIMLFSYEKLKIFFHEKQEMYEQFIYGLVDIVEKRDTYTGGHSKRVAKYSKMLANEMGYGEKEQELIYRASMLHDIGKIAIPDSIFLKPGKLNRLEYDMIKEHVNMSYEMIKNIDVFKDLREIIRNHHEHFDGCGYPRGLNGSQSPLLAQIVSLCDAFDAMTTKRIYKKHMPVHEALKELSALSGKQFNPEIVKIALRAFANIIIEEESQNLLINNLDKERIEYFFKDRLTNLFKKTYLNTILEKEHSQKALYIISLHNFSQYNKKYGWDKGDLKLKQMAGLLSDTSIFPFAIVFRIHGDDFVILNDDFINIDTILEPIIKEFKSFNIDISYKAIDISKNKIRDVEELSALF